MHAVLEYKVYALKTLTELRGIVAKGLVRFWYRDKSLAFFETSSLVILCRLLHEHFSAL